MRHLATIQKVSDVTKIPGADSVEMAHVLGWQCIVPNGLVKKGGLCAFFEIGSFLPDTPLFSFLNRKNMTINQNSGEKGWVVRVSKLFGCYSQGLVLSAEDVKKALVSYDGDLYPGMNIGTLLGVTLYVPDAPAGTEIGLRPADIPFMCDLHAQSILPVFPKYSLDNYYIQTKIDGLCYSALLDIKNDTFRISDNYMEYKNDGKNIFSRYVLETNLEKKMKSAAGELDFGIKTLVVQGILCGPGIHGNRMNLKKMQWYADSVLINGRPLSLYDAQKYCAFMDLRTAPVEEIGSGFFEKYTALESLLERADGTVYGGGKKEGIIVRSIGPGGWEGSFSVQVLNPRYFLARSAGNTKRKAACTL